jgi:Copper type II ascorbate-dependent monooxygenase, N-terminal domain/DOMON domain/Copper type II ascorbate-dependent monooxygenase, C-terminal domain
MKLSTTVLLSALVLSRSERKFAAALDCTATSRADQDRAAACDHFQGVNHESYLNWYVDSDIATKYPNQVYLVGSDPDSPENGAAVHWSVDEEYVHLAVAARATGWLAFGISEAGGMIGTDMVMFEASRPGELVDAYTSDERYPQVDDCAGNWEMVASNVDTGGEFIMFETKRLLNTNDPQDKPIVNDSSSLMSPHRVIAAWGDTEEVGYHGLNRARGSIRFYGTGDAEATFLAEMERSSQGSFEVRAREYNVPEMETYYAYVCTSREDMIEQGVLNTTNGLNVIGWEPIVQAGNEAYVHHFVVHASSQPTCPENVTNEETFANYPEVAYVWAPGEGGLSLPDFLGAPLFGADGFQSYVIEIHYNVSFWSSGRKQSLFDQLLDSLSSPVVLVIAFLQNPTLASGVVDSSGVRMYWTAEAREEQVGILSVGDPGIGLFGELVGTGVVKHEFDCPSSCSSAVNQTVTVVREYLHMHQTGLRMTNEQMRGEDVVRVGRVENWEFEQNGNIAVQQEPFVVNPGDGFHTTCYYEDPEGTRRWGIGSAEEMCMAFLYCKSQNLALNHNMCSDVKLISPRMLMIPFYFWRTQIILVR